MDELLYRWLAEIEMQAVEELEEAGEHEAAKMHALAASTYIAEANRRVSDDV